MGIFKKEKKEKTVDEKLEDMKNDILSKLDEKEMLMYKLMVMSGTKEQIFMFGYHVAKHHFTEKIISMMPEKMRVEFDKFSDNEDCGDPKCEAHDRTK